MPLRLLPLLLSPALVHAACECGYTLPSSSSNNTDQGTILFTHAIETDFTAPNTNASLFNGDGKGDWAPQNYTVMTPDSNGPWGKNASLANVQVTADGMTLFSRSSAYQDKPNGPKVLGMAEVASLRSDIVFGTMRAGIKYSDVKGTCGAWFWYHNDTAELDMEYLSIQSPSSTSSNILVSSPPDPPSDDSNITYPLNLVMQSPQHNPQNDPLTNLQNLTFNPTTGVHEYRIDWLPDSVTFSVDSTTLSRNLSNLPAAAPGHLSLSHWSNGNQGWSGGPPARDAAMLVSWVRAYFNVSDAAEVDEWRKGCEKKTTAVCVIDDAKGDAVARPVFLQGGGKGTGGSAGKGKDGGKGNQAARMGVGTLGLGGLWLGMLLVGLGFVL